MAIVSGLETPKWLLIFTALIKTHIISLDYTLSALQKAAGFLKAISSDDGVVLFLGTKQTSSEIIEEEAKRTGMPYINQRWLGGMLTNFKTTCNSVTKLKDLEESIASGTLKSLTKKEGLKLISKKRTADEIHRRRPRHEKNPGCAFCH